MEILTDKISLKSHQFSNINGEGSINTISLFSSGFMNEIPLAEGLRLMPKLEKNFKEKFSFVDELPFALFFSSLSAQVIQWNIIVIRCL